MAHKAHKNHCLSTSGACDFRAADAVCVWNDVEKSIANFRSQAGLHSEPFTVRYAVGADRKCLKRKILDSAVGKKKRRIELRQEREILRKSNEKANCGFSMEIDMPVNTDDVNKKRLKIVYFDLETTGLDTNAEIVQLAAKCGKYEFNAYVNPSKEISRSASKVAGLSNFGGMLCLNGDAVKSMALKDVLFSFKQFLQSL